MNEAVTYESRDNVAIITINRPERRNAINDDVASGLSAAWKRLENGSDMVGILTGAGGNFCVGADLHSLPKDFPSSVPGTGSRLSKPLIAAVDGWCVGGGLVLVQQCDLCVATEAAKFLYPEARVGRTGGMIAGIAARMPHKMAMELMLVGAPFPAQRAYEAGFVNRVVPAEELLPAALDYAAKIRLGAPLVHAQLKAMVDEIVPLSSAQHAARVRLQLAEIGNSEDCVEGVRAFREKRPPVFKGK